MFNFAIASRNLRFRFEAGTSRGVLTEKTSFFIELTHPGWMGRVGVGECAPLKGLSIDYMPNFGQKLEYYANLFAKLDDPWQFYDLPDIQRFPSIIMGIETAMRDWERGGYKEIFNPSFVDNGLRIPINGLVWMGSKESMKQQLEEKIAAGFTCVKIKVGAIDFEQECELLGYVRKQFGPSDMVLRVDANGAFTPANALEKLKRLSEYRLHSIEQPIAQGQHEEMARLCATSPVPIALDEEMIGVSMLEEQQALLQTIKPQYIILKPTLHGGFRACKEWIELAEQRKIGWWMTSALEANIGLNAIAQFAASHAPRNVHQGLGTGQLFQNNIPSPLTIEKGHIYWDRHKTWGH